MTITAVVTSNSQFTSQHRSPRLEVRPEGVGTRSCNQKCDRIQTAQKHPQAENPVMRCPYCGEGGNFKVMIGQTAESLGTRALDADI